MSENTRGMETRDAGEEKIERRFYDVVELRAKKGDDGKRTLVGHAAVFDRMSVPMWGFREMVAKGAFAKTIKNDDIRALWNHDGSEVLGRNKNSKSLRLSEDTVGLAIEIDLPNTQRANDAFELISRGDVSQMSFAFKTISDRWHIQDEQEIRTLVEVRLFDVSPVTFPAYPDTDISVRAHYDAALRSHEVWKRSIATGRPIEALQREIEIEEAS